MNSVIGSLLALCVLPQICAWIGGYFRKVQLGSVDNKHPRTQALQLSGAGARIIAAQANCWEALAVFTAAIVAVFISGLALDSVASLCLIVVALRVFYIGFYLANIDSLRSLSFIAGYGICIYMFYLALTAAS